MNSKFITCAFLFSVLLLPIIISGCSCGDDDDNDDNGDNGGGGSDSCRSTAAEACNQLEACTGSSPDDCRNTICDDYTGVQLDCMAAAGDCNDFLDCLPDEDDDTDDDTSDDTGDDDTESTTTTTTSPTTTTAPTSTTVTTTSSTTTTTEPFSIQGVVTINGDTPLTALGDNCVGTTNVIYHRQTDDRIHLSLTDDDGAYAVPYVDAGTYDAEIEIDVMCDNRNYYYRHQYDATGVAVDGQITRDIDLTFAAVNGTISDPDGDAVTALEATFSLSEDTDSMVEIEAKAYSMDGTYSMMLPPDSDYEAVYSPDPALALPIVKETGVAVATPTTTYDYQYPEEAYLLEIGVHVNGSWLTTILGSGASGTFTFEPTTDADGSIYKATLWEGYNLFDIALPDGEYDIYMELEVDHALYDFEYKDYVGTLTVPVTVDADAYIELSFAEITGTVSDPSAEPLSSISVDVESGLGTRGPSFYSGSASTDSAGEYTLMVPDENDFDFTFDTWNYDEYASGHETGVAVSGDATHDFTFPDNTVFLTGTLTFNGVTPMQAFDTIFVAGEMYAFDQDGVPYFGNMDLDGTYSIPLAPNKTYDVTLFIVTPIGMFLGFIEYELTIAEDLAVTADAVRDMDSDLYTVSGTILGPGGGPSSFANMAAVNNLSYLVPPYDYDSYTYSMNYMTQFEGTFEFVAPSGTLHFMFYDYEGHTEYRTYVAITEDTTLDFSFLTSSI